MEWIDFWNGIQYLFEKILFIPFDWLRTLQLESWWLSNMVSWVFLLTGAAAFIYWMKCLNDFHEDEKQNAAHSAHEL